MTREPIVRHARFDVLLTDLRTGVACCSRLSARHPRCPVGPVGGIPSRGSKPDLLMTRRQSHAANAVSSSPNSSLTWGFQTAPAPNPLSAAPHGHISLTPEGRCGLRRGRFEWYPNAPFARPPNSGPSLDWVDT